MHHVSVTHGCYYMGEVEGVIVQQNALHALHFWLMHLTACQLVWVPNKAGGAIY